jgi:hypothetical protein
MLRIRTKLRTREPNIKNVPANQTAKKTVAVNRVCESPAGARLVSEMVEASDEITGCEVRGTV